MDTIFFRLTRTQGCLSFCMGKRQKLTPEPVRIFFLSRVDSYFHSWVFIRFSLIRVDILLLICDGTKRYSFRCGVYTGFDLSAFNEDGGIKLMTDVAPNGSRLAVEGIEAHGDSHDGSSRCVQSFFVDVMHCHCPYLLYLYPVSLFVYVSVYLPSCLPSVCSSPVDYVSFYFFVCCLCGFVCVPVSLVFVLFEFSLSITCVFSWSNLLVLEIWSLSFAHL